MKTIYKLGICLLICCSTPFTSASDICPYELTTFCTCENEYVGFSGSNQSAGAPTIAPTTAPEKRFYYHHTIVECNLVTRSRSSLEEVVSRLYRKSVDRLTVLNVPSEKEQPIVNLPYHWLQHVRVKHFQIKNTALSGEFIWKGKPFDGQEKSLAWLTAMGCSLTGSLTKDTLGSINTKGLEELPRLEGLDLSENHLMSVEACAFTNKHPLLATIILSRNVIQEVKSGAFRRLNKLRYVDLSHNMLENIKRDIFESKPKYLKKINISWNRMKYLPEDIFSNMTSLKYVDVSYNFLFSMPEKPWKSVWWKLKYISVIGNFVECNCDLKWMFSNSTSILIESEERVIKGECATRPPSLLSHNIDLYLIRLKDLMCESQEDL
ncbi:protein artichoke-like [Stegodyphus dumicola]|uniref:protein artichoke-like n=1 Tax=Stegodyphus dumicola TaxID=202533 RepID=UPI0015AE705F|nr:protein artichoke-like [Stegodyphus dumicola]